jgi:hypothetical protein
MDPICADAVYFESIRTEIWRSYEASNALVDSVLSIEKALRDAVMPSNIKGVEERGQAVKESYSVRYASDYQSQMDGMVERRLRASIHFLSSLWFTCWVDAGQPRLENFRENRALNDSFALADTSLNRSFQQGKILGRKEPSH